MLAHRRAKRRWAKKNEACLVGYLLRSPRNQVANFEWVPQACLYDQVVVFESPTLLVPTEADHKFPSCPYPVSLHTNPKPIRDLFANLAAIKASES